MDRGPIPEIVNGLPNLCGADAQVEEVTRPARPGLPAETNLQLDRLQAVFADRAAHAAAADPGRRKRPAHRRHSSATSTP